ncbi:MAG: phospholipid transport system substrate-binding protein [Lysobacterales bacterium]|jgi:phospholipid transport system substrate-binding protein
MKKRLLKFAALAMLIITGLATANDQLEDPSHLITETAGKIFEQINSQRDAIKDDPSIAEDIVRSDLLPLMDINYSARLILGREARNASPEQLSSFAIAMNDLLISRYASGLLEFRSKEQIEVLEMRGQINPKATPVKTRVRLDSGGHALVDYVFRMTDEGWKIFDVVVEGISYIVSFRNQIKQEIGVIGLDAVIERISQGDLDLAG